MSNIHLIAITVICLTTLYLLYMYYKKNEKRLAIIENNIQKISQSINHISTETNIEYEKDNTEKNNYNTNNNSQYYAMNNYNTEYQKEYETQNKNLSENKPQEYVHSEQELQKEFEKYKVQDESNGDSENSEGSLKTNSENEIDSEEENEIDDSEEENEIENDLDNEINIENDILVNSDNTENLVINEYNIEESLFEDKIKIINENIEIKELITKEIQQINLDDIEKMTVTQIKDILNEKEINFTSKLRKDELKNLLIENLENKI